VPVNRSTPLLRKVLFWAAVAGWLASLVAHGLSLADIDVQRYVPPVMLLHLGIFVVMVPAILELRRNEAFQRFEASGLRNRMNPFASMKVFFAGLPTWMAVIAGAGFFYAVVNFLIFAANIPGSASIMEGRYVLYSHGTILRYITRAEYDHFKAQDLRGFSGHWIAFYGMGAALLFPYKKEEVAKDSGPGRNSRIPI
jgi:hypothetical protein